MGRRFWTRCLIGVLVVSGVIVGGEIGFRFVVNPNVHFLNYVDAYATGWRSSAMRGRPAQDRAWIDGHEAEVVDEGRRACSWLATRPDAPGSDGAGWHDPSRLALQYVRHAEGQDVPLAPMTKWDVVVGAWNYLCYDELVAKTPAETGGDD